MGKSRIAPRIEIWLSHEPMEESQNRYMLTGDVRLDDRITSMLEPIQLKQNDTALCLSTLKHTDGRSPKTAYGIKGGEFRFHYALNRNPGNPEHLKAVSALDLETRRDLATASGMLPLTTLSITLTTDGYMVIGERNSANVITTGLQPMPSGFATTTENDTRGTPSTFGNIYNEFFEELFLVQKFPQDWVRERQGYYANEIAKRAGEGREYVLEMIMKQAAPSAYTKDEVRQHIGRVMLHGLTYSDDSNRGFTNIFSIESKLTGEEISEILEHNRRLWPEARREANKYRFVPFTQFHIAEFIERDFGAINNHSIAGILLVGKNVFNDGERWYQSMLDWMSTAYPSDRDSVLELPAGYFEEEKSVPETIFSIHNHPGTPRPLNGHI